MPTPLELLLDPVSVGVIAIFGALSLWETLNPARQLPEVSSWRLRGLLSFAAFFFLSSYSDLPVFDLLFGTFYNPKEFAPETGFYHGASSRVTEMVCFRDVSTPPFDAIDPQLKEQMS